MSCNSFFVNPLFDGRTNVKKVVVVPPPDYDDDSDDEESGLSIGQTYRDQNDEGSFHWEI